MEYILATEIFIAVLSIISWWYIEHRPFRKKSKQDREARTYVKQLTKREVIGTQEGPVEVEPSISDYSRSIEIPLDSLITSVSSCTMTFPISIINQPYVARVPEVPEPPKKKEIEVTDFPTGLRRRIVLE